MQCDVCNVNRLLYSMVPRSCVVAAARFCIIVPHFDRVQHVWSVCSVFVQFTQTVLQHGSANAKSRRPPRICTSRYDIEATLACPSRRVACMRVYTHRPQVTFRMAAVVSVGRNMRTHYHHCITLHCNAMHCIALHCLALRCNALPCTALH